MNSRRVTLGHWPVLAINDDGEYLFWFGFFGVVVGKRVMVFGKRQLFTMLKGRHDQTHTD